MCPLCDQGCKVWRLSDTCTYAKVIPRLPPSNIWMRRITSSPLIFSVHSWVYCLTTTARWSLLCSWQYGVSLSVYTQIHMFKQVQSVTQHFKQFRLDRDTLFKFILLSAANLFYLAASFSHLWDVAKAISQREPTPLGYLHILTNHGHLAVGGVEAVIYVICKNINPVYIKNNFGTVYKKCIWK